MVKRTLWLDCLGGVAQQNYKDVRGSGSRGIRIGHSSRLVGAVVVKDWNWIGVEIAAITTVAVEEGGRCSCTSLLA